MTVRRLWCFLVHRWWGDFPETVDVGIYSCTRCAEKWGRP